MLSTEQKLLAALAHGGKFLGGPIIIPLIIMLLNNDEYIKEQAKESLVFELVMAGCLFISGILVIILIGFVGLIVFGIMTIIFPIIAIINVVDGKYYTYPITGKWARKL
jgi:uncharacterized protein